MMGRIRRALDRLALYLPGVLMALFALGSWWLVRSLPTMFNDAPTKAVRHEPDYYLEQFSVKSFDSKGHLTRELSGKRAQHFPDSDTLEMTHVIMRGQNAEGQRMNARADRAIATSDGTQVNLLGDVQLTQLGNSRNDTAPTELRSQHIQSMLKEEHLSSDGPVEIRRGQDVFSANSMQLNSKTGEYELNGKVRGVIHPAKR